MTQGDTVDVATAGLILGISSDAVRARIRRGTLDADRDGPHKAWRVHLPEGSPTAPGPTVGALTAELLDAYRRQVEELQLDKRRLSDQVDVLTAQNIALTQRILPPPDERPDTGPIVTPPPEDAQDAPQGPSWLDRIL